MSKLRPMKPGPISAKPLSLLLNDVFAEAYAKQGFAARELVPRVEGPMALEIQHSADVILQRVNRFFGWSAVGKLAFRQAPLSRARRPTRPAPPDAKSVAGVAERLGDIEDEQLKSALARLGAAI